jgi:hypothetical protein
VERIPRGIAKVYFVRARDLADLSVTGGSTVLESELRLALVGVGALFLNASKEARPRWVLMVLKVLHLLDMIPSFNDETQALVSFRPPSYRAKA